MGIWTTYHLRDVLQYKEWWPAYLCKVHALGGMVGVAERRCRARQHDKYAYIMRMHLWQWLVSESGAAKSPTPLWRRGGL